MAQVPVKPRQIGGNDLLPSHGVKLRIGAARISRNGPRYELCGGSLCACLMRRATIRRRFFFWGIKQVGAPSPNRRSIGA
jgi:hypothetical protein